MPSTVSQLGHLTVNIYIFRATARARPHRVALEPDEFRNVDIDDRYVKPDKTPDVEIDFDQIDKRIQKYPLPALPATSP